MPTLYHYNPSGNGSGSTVIAVPNVNGSGHRPPADVDVGRHPLCLQRSGPTDRERGAGYPENQQLASHGVPPSRLRLVASPASSLSEPRAIT